MSAMAAPDVLVRRVHDRLAGTVLAVLVDRVFRRGVTKTEVELDEWCRAVAPSAALLLWLGHDLTRLAEFDRRYRAELAEPERAEALRHLQELAQSRR
jgi:uncharacterized protein YeaO (DUF488 family)